MENKNQLQIDELEIKIDTILASVKKTERYMKVTFWSTVVLVVLPMVIAVFVVPVVVSKYLSMYEGLI